jgi:hypothetical protein
MINGDLGSFKRVAPLCLSFCRGASFLNIEHRRSQQEKTVIWFVLFGWLNETNQMNQINQINKTNQITLSYTGQAGHQSSAV